MNTYKNVLSYEEFINEELTWKEIEKKSIVLLCNLKIQKMKTGNSKT